MLQLLNLQDGWISLYLVAYYKCKMLEKCLLSSRCRKYMHSYGISTKLCNSSCCPFHLCVLCFVQQEDNLNPVSKQIWAASAWASPRIWRAGEWYAGELELSGCRPAGVEKQSRSSARCSGYSALSLQCRRSAARLGLASACTPAPHAWKQGGPRPRPSARGVRPGGSALLRNHSCFFLCLCFVGRQSCCVGSKGSLSTLSDAERSVIARDAGCGAGGHQPAPARTRFSVRGHDSSLSTEGASILKIWVTVNWRHSAGLELKRNCEETFMSLSFWIYPLNGANKCIQGFWEHHVARDRETWH